MSVTVSPLTPEIAPGLTDRTRLRRAAEAFEAFLVQTLLQAMRRAQLQEGFFGKGPGASTYQSMFEQELSLTFARSSPLGIADALESRWTGGLDGLERAESALRELESERALGAYLEIEPGASAARPGAPGPAQVAAERADK